MSKITHHISEPMLIAYAAGNLPKPFAVVVASHISLCAQCRATVEAHQSVGGVLLEASETADISESLKAGVLDMLDTPLKSEPVYERAGIYPAPVVEALQGKSPKWKSLGRGVKQNILSQSDEGSVRLLFIPPGQAVPDHSHNGLELTLVLQGSFSDEEGKFGVGDVEIGDEDLEHTPIAGDGCPCICLAATDAPLKFNAFLPRLLQPIFRI